MIIKSVELPNEQSHKISAKGSKIGRNSSNEIVIFDESVSRYHAQIFYKNEIFYLSDIGSTTGTFIKIEEPIRLQENMIIEIGSFQLIIKNIEILKNSDDSVNEEESKISLEIYESAEEVVLKTFNLFHGSSIGRKTNNFLCFNEDLHMSNLHCRVNLVGNNFIFEDLASTNGSWLRLSKEGVKSEPFLLTQDVIFKIGNSAMYQVYFPKTPSKNVNEMNTIISKESGGENDKCVVCWDLERDCLIMPCRHNITCVKCTKSLKNCPICRMPLVDIIKIYKP